MFEGWDIFFQKCSLRFFSLDFTCEDESQQTNYFRKVYSVLWENDFLMGELLKHMFENSLFTLRY